MFTRDHLDAWLQHFAAAVKANKAHLTELDAAIGDADHGANLDRGLSTLTAALPDEPTLGAALRKTGMVLVSNVGGASGPLFGTFFMRLGGALGEVEEASPELLAEALRAGVDGVAARGRSTTGEKTMLDVLVPARDTFTLAVEQGESLQEALQQMAESARAGRANTSDMVATKGRASYLGERSRGHIDPGATSATYLVEALAEAVS